MLAIGIDIGGSNLRAALVDREGNLTRSAKRPFGDRAPTAVLDQIEGLVRELGPEAQKAPIAVGIAAQLWLETGVVAVAPNIGWRDVPFGSMLIERFRRPVRLVNDLDAITYGEALKGVGRGERHVACVFVGTGVGMGAVVDGSLLEGADGLATELGHIKVASPVDGRLCGCSERGCLEAYTSGGHLPQRLIEKVRSGLRSPLVEEVGEEPSALTAMRIDAAAHAGDPAALALWDEVGERLGRAIANMVIVLNPRVLVLGGGVLTSAKLLFGKTKEQLLASMARPALKHLSIRGTALGDDAGLVGAGLLAHQGPATRV